MTNLEWGDDERKTNFGAAGFSHGNRSKRNKMWLWAVSELRISGSFQACFSLARMSMPERLNDVYYDEGDVILLGHGSGSPVAYPGEQLL